MENFTFDIATGRTASSRQWKNLRMDWFAFVERFREPHRTPETHKEFLAAKRTEQSRIKDNGGYVGGYLTGGKRGTANVLHRQLLTLDLDFAPAFLWDDLTLMMGEAALMHSTHKHTPAAPRYRLVIPLDRTVSPDEYLAISRMVASWLGMDYFDPTSFQTNRLMFWPSTSSDGVYEFHEQKGPILNADSVLASYTDWSDVSAWPTCTSELDTVHESLKKQQDPLAKKGIIGAFCRTYPISEVIDAHLSEEYTTTGDDDRYTYAKGSTVGGLVVYEDKFAFSHHGTDPASNSLCNAFDLVRLHKFGHLDSEGQKGTSAPSFKAMEQLCTEDRAVRRTIAQERVENAKFDYADEAPEPEEIAGEWTEELEVDNKGKYLSSAANLNLIFKNDPGLKGRFKRNNFDGKNYVFDSVPWRKIEQPEPFRNVDFSGARNYIESIYGITGNIKIEDCLALEFESCAFHPVRDYLHGLEWDGVDRVDNLLTKYFGVESTPYTREAIKCMLLGAVARVMTPGVKFDLVLTLVGAQGTGKSTFINRLGAAWFSDSFMTVKGKEAFEQLQGAWLIEMAELAGLRKAETEAIKHFISKQEDTYRPAYGRTPETYKRQCVFFGTTNNKDFLRDPSGNRRFMPIDIEPQRAARDVFKCLQKDEVDQIWAEAFERWDWGEQIYLSKEAEAIAAQEQHKHSEYDERAGVVEDYLNTLLPEDWADMTADAKELYFLNGDTDGTVQRDTVCIAEIWCECLGKPREDMDRYKTREINDIMKSLEGWEQSSSTRTFKPYGKQKYYYKNEQK